MTTFTNKQKDSIMEEARKLFDSCARGETTLDIMTRIYVDSLEDKTEAQGKVMAEVIINEVKTFDSDFKDAQENLDKFISDFRSKINENKSPEERCTYWLRFNAALSAAIASTDADSETDRETTLKNIETLTVSAEQATPEYEKELADETVELLKNSGIMLSGLNEYCNALEEIADGDKTATMLIDVGSKEINFRAIASMIAYTKIKNGEFDNLPADMTAEQVTTLICAEVEQVRIAEAAHSGSIAEEVAAFLLKVLGAIVLVKFALFGLDLGLAFVNVIFGSFLVIPATVIVFALLFHLLSKALDIWCSDSNKIVTTASACIKVVVSGAKAIFNYAKNHIFPAIGRIAKGIWNCIKVNSSVVTAK